MTIEKNKIQVIDIANPFEPYAKSYRTIDYAPGKTLADLFPSVLMRQELVFSINGKIIEEDAKALTYPQAGDVVVTCPVIAGGGGGGEGGESSGKSILRIVAVVALAFFTGGAGGFASTIGGAVGTAGYSLAYAGIMMAGSMVINAMLPPPKASNAAAANGASETPPYGIDGPKNVSAEGIVVPVVYGTHRYGGNLINAYVTNENTTQLLHLLFNCGEGPIGGISNILVNDQPIESYADYQIEQRLGLPTDAGVPWFAQQIVPRSVGQELTTEWIYRVTETEVDQLRLDVVAPSGMYGAWETKAGNYVLYTPVLAEVRPVGTQDWLPFSDESMVISGNQKTALRRSFYSRNLPQGKYEVRMRRDRKAGGGPEAGAPPGMAWIDNVVASDLNEIQFEQVNYKHTALLGVRIRLTDQLGGLPTVTHMNAGKVIRCWDAATGQWINKASSNPAWISLDALTNKRYGAGYPLSRFDLERWKEWAAHCDANNLQFNGVFDTQSNAWDALQPVFRCGHAGRTNVGTRFSVAIERAEAPRMMFSVANMIQGTFKQNWLSAGDRANELEISYIDKTDGYRQKTMRVVDTKVRNKQPKSSQINFFGLTSFDEAWRDAMILLNQNRLLMQTVEFSAPLEAIACAVGDVVLVQHDMPKWSLAGRLEAGSTLSKVMLDRPVQMDPNEVYSVLVHMSAVKRFTGTVSFIQGTAIFVSGFNGAGPVKRAKVAGRDVEVQSVIQQGSSWGVILANVDGIAAGAAVELWDTDAIETRNVVNLAATAGTEYTELTLTTPLPAAPEIYTQWMFGKVNRTGKPFRIRSIRGTHDYQRDITALEYNADSYLPSPAPTPPNYSDLERFVKHAVIEGADEEVFLIGPITRSRVTVRYRGADETYFTSVVYMSRNGELEQRVGEDPSQVTVEAAIGDELAFRVVARDSFMRSAPRSTAPTTYYQVVGRTKLPNDATGLTASVDATGWVASWDAATDPDVTASELRIGASWESGRLLWRGNATSCRFAFQAAGEHQLRLRHCIGQADGLYSGADCIKTLTILPPTQPVLAGEVSGRTVSLVWQDCVATQPLFGYKVEVSTSADDRAEVGSSSTPTFQRIEATPGARLYWVTAVDVAGNLGAPGQISLETLPSIDEALDELEQGLDDVIADLGQTNNNLAAEVTNRINALAAEAAARAAAIAAEATARANALAQETTNRNAAIAAEAALRLNADQAEVTARTNAILAEAENRNAAIANEASTRSTAVQAEATARTNLATRLDNADAVLTSAIQNESTIRSTADEAEAKQRESLGITLIGRPDVAADVTRVVGPSFKTDFTTATALYQVWEPATSLSSGWLYDEQQARITADQAEAASRESLATQLRGGYSGTDLDALSSGLVHLERVARSAADTAEAIARQSLQTTVTNNKTATDAAITNEAQTRSQADAAEATQRETLAVAITGVPSPSAVLSSVVGASLALNMLAVDLSVWEPPSVDTLSSGLLFQERSARITADKAEATAREALAVTVTGNKAAAEAAMQNEQTVRATADTANADAITALSSTVNSTTNGLPSKAANTALTALSTRVTNVEGTVTSQGDAITSLNSSLELGRTDSQASLTADESMANFAAWRSHYNQDLAPRFVTVTDGKVSKTVCRSPATLGSFWNYSKSKIVIDPARTYRFSAWFRRVGANGAHYWNWWMNTANTYGNRSITLDSLPDNTWVKLSYDLLGSSFGDTSVSPGFALNHTNGTTGYTEIQGYRFEDVTDSLRLSGVETSKADATAVNALTTRVTNAEGLITSQGSAITNLNSSLSTTNTNVTAAQSAAQAAADAAGAKGKVIYGTTAPAVADRLAQNLWIDTTSNANTPKRWSGSAWVAVTDKVATDAAAAAAAAQSTANTKADASAVTALTTRVTNAEGTITSQASSLSTLTATVNGHTSSISTTSQALATLDGKVKSTWRLNVDANGKTSGIILDNNGNTSSLVMVVDKFAIATAGAGGTVKYPFIVGTVAGATSIGINGNMYVDGSITTRTLAAEAVTADKVKAKSLTADQIAAGAVTADLINVGVGSNLVPDSGFMIGGAGTHMREGFIPTGWATWSTFSGAPIYGINQAGHDWHPPGQNACSIYQPNTNSSSVQDKSAILQVHTPQIPVEPGQRYEFSVYTGAHRCEVFAVAEAYDAGGVNIGLYPSTTTNNAEKAGGRLLSAWKRIGVFFTAPANAAYVVLTFRKLPTKPGQTAEPNSWMFITMPMFAQATAYQTVFSPYTHSGMGTQISPYGIDTPNLSAISATVGLLRTQTSGARTEIEANQIRVYDGNNVLRVRMGIW